MKEKKKFLSMQNAIPQMILRKNEPYKEEEFLKVNISDYSEKPAEENIIIYGKKI